MKALFLVSLLVFVTPTFAQYYSSQPFIERTVAQESESHSKSSFRVVPDERPAYMRGFPRGASSMPDSHGSSYSYQNNWFTEPGVTRSTSSNHDISSTPSYDYQTGQPTIEISENSSSSKSEERREVVGWWDYYHRPVIRGRSQQPRIQPPLPPAIPELKLGSAAPVNPVPAITIANTGTNAPNVTVTKGTNTTTTVIKTDYVTITVVNPAK